MITRVKQAVKQAWDAPDKVFACLIYVLAILNIIQLVLYYNLIK
jgi:hypothetical protein